MENKKILKYAFCFIRLSFVWLENYSDKFCSILMGSVLWDNTHLQSIKICYSLQ